MPGHPAGRYLGCPQWQLFPDRERAGLYGQLGRHILIGVSIAS